MKPRAAPRRPVLRRLRCALRWAALAGLAVFFAGGIALNRMPQGATIGDAAEARALTASAALGLVVTNIEVAGRKTTDTATILAALGARRGTPIFAVDPDRARRRLERLAWVRSATIERRLPGTLFVRLVEREPLAVWQHDGRQQLIDRQGEVIPVNNLARFSRLPTVVGAEAARHAPALLQMLAQHPTLASHVTAAVRVDNRRWTLRLDHRIDVLLPENDAAAAWTRLARLQRDKEVLQRDVEAIDLRLPDRLVLRVATPLGRPAALAGKAPRAGNRR